MTLQPPEDPQYREFFAKNFKVPSIGPTHRREFEIFLSFHTPHHRGHTQGTLKIFKLLTHHTTEPIHRGIFKKSNSPHTTEPTHRGTLKKIKLSTHTTEPTHRGTLKKFKLSTPHHRAHTGELFENFQSLYTQGKKQEKSKSPHTRKL